MSKNFNIQKILVAPLDWGLGHATRDIVLIRALLAHGYEVLIGAEGAQASLLHTEFPTVQILPLQGYRMRYSKTKWGFLFTILVQLPKVYRMIVIENRWLAKMIAAHQIDLVISDNRFGLHSKKIASIFITHQLTVKAPFQWLENCIQKVNYHYINQFKACWVPDVAGIENAAGILSHPVVMPQIPVTYIGLLARFQQTTAIKKYDYCILLSGPEPQRTLLEKKIVVEITADAGEIIIIRGKPGSNETIPVPANVKILNHLPTADLQAVILQSAFIVCRGGYTSLMELLSLQKKLLLIPTPGQTEQEYLAQRLMDHNICVCIPQEQLKVREHFTSIKKFDYQLPAFSLFNNAMINELLKN